VRATLTWNGINETANQIAPPDAWVSMRTPVSTGFSNAFVFFLHFPDIAVYRPSTGTWWILKSSSNFTTYLTQQWGVGTDVPIK
jgi:hypothetical protein